MKYNKICKICGSEFISDSHNSVYCSDKCAKNGAKRKRKSIKMKHINAVRRGDDKEIENLITVARKVARDVAKLTLAKVCNCKDKDHVCEGKLVVHHINHLVLDNRPQNLQWLCEKAHHEIHSQEEDCSNIEEIKAFITIRKQEEIRKRNSIIQKERNSRTNCHINDSPSETHSTS